MHLRRAAQRVGVLHRGSPCGGWPRSPSRPAGRRRFGRSRPARAAGAAPAGRRRRRGRCRAAPRRSSRPSTSAAAAARQVVEGEDEHAEDPVGAVDQRQPLLGRSTSGVSPARPARRPRRPARPASPPRPRRSAPARSGRGRQVAARAERAVLGHDRREAGVEQGELQVDHLGARPSGPWPGCGRAAAASPAPPRLDRRPHAGGVRADQHRSPLRGDHRVGQGPGPS